MSHESPRLTNEELRDVLAVLSTWDEHTGGYCDDVLDQLSVTFDHATGTPSIALSRRDGPEVRMALTPATTAVLKAALNTAQAFKAVDEQPQRPAARQDAGAQAPGQARTTFAALRAALDDEPRSPAHPLDKHKRDDHEQP